LEVVTIKHEQLAKVGLSTAGHSLLLPLLLGQWLRFDISIDVVLQVLLIRLLDFLDCPLEVRVWYSCVRARRKRERVTALARVFRVFVI
jgi:hypothetical protein